MVPATFVASPAYAAVIPGLTITPAANWEGGGLAFKVTYAGTGPSTVTFTTDITAHTAEASDFTAMPTLSD